MSVTNRITGTAGFLRTPRGTLVPRIITGDFLRADVERNMVVAEYALLGNCDLPDDDGWVRRVLMDVVAAIADDAGLVVLYRNDEGEVTSRVLFPEWVTVTKARNLSCRAFCTLRREYRSFRLDRILDVHTLTLPCERAA